MSIQKELQDRVEIKGIKTFIGREGYGVNCSVYFDGKKIATYIDTADGGEGSLETFDKNEKKYKNNKEKVEEINSLLKKLGKNSYGFDYEIADIVNEVVDYKTFAKNLKRSIVVGIPQKTEVLGLNMPKDSYGSYKFKMNIKDIPENKLKTIKEKITKDLKKGEIIFN